MSPCLRLGSINSADFCAGEVGLEGKEVEEDRIG